MQDLRRIGKGGDAGRLTSINRFTCEYLDSVLQRAIKELTLTERAPISCYS
jgi:hypothetical protein